MTCKNCKYSEKSNEQGFYFCSKLSSIFPHFVVRKNDDDQKLLVPENFKCKYYERRIV